MKTLKLKLEEEDHLIYQLYIASKSERIKKKRKSARIRIPIIYLILALIVYFSGQVSFALALAVFGSLWFLFYPQFERKRYYKHYKSFVKENFKDRLEKEAIINLGVEEIELIDESGNSKLKVEKIDEISEIENYYFIKLNKAAGLILPKRKIEDLESVKEWIEKAVEKYQLKKNVELDWKWK